MCVENKVFQSNDAFRVYICSKIVVVTAGINVLCYKFLVMFLV
jgi:hypothetical protein